MATESTPLPELHLTWEPLRGWKDLAAHPELTKESGRPGVYIWGFQVESAFTPYYVGKAENLYERALQHMTSLYGGAYTVYPWTRLIDWHAAKPVYEPTGPAAFANRMRDFRTDFEAAIEAFRIAWAKVEDADTAAAERTLAYRFGGPRYLGTRVKATEEFMLIAEGDSTVVSLFSVSPPVSIPVAPQG